MPTSPTRLTRWAIGLVLPACVVFTTARGDDPPKPPVQLTAKEDHQRMMDLLNINELRREGDGRVPKDTPQVKWEVTATDKQTVGDVPVVTKRLVGHVDNTSYPLVSVDIQLTLTTPANAAGPVPVILEFGFGFGGKGPAG